MKYAALCYGNQTSNLGDDIQTLAALQFLPKCDCFVNREELGLYSSNSPTFMIANGWYMNSTQYFPPSDSLRPFYISMHIHNVDVLAEPRSVSHLKQHGPVGCRDYGTYELFKRRDIPAYFSSCLTLTLKNKFKSRSDKIYIVDVDSAFRRIVIPERIKKRAIYLTHATDTTCTSSRLKKAQELLDLYAQAKLVITGRLHCALPCLALGTPVVLLRFDPYDPRFGAISRYLYIHSHGDRIDWDSPPVDVSDQAKFLSDLCEEAVRIGDNPLKHDPVKCASVIERHTPYPVKRKKTLRYRFYHFALRVYGVMTIPRELIKKLLRTARRSCL